MGSVIDFIITNVVAIMSVVIDIVGLETLEAPEHGRGQDCGLCFARFELLT